ncbi:hypothetical protein NQZ68_034323 [Dissostichus eleginoides]|nr:hypothetical protein NQZ68_034323 [Dissostichus eleginoides]
MSSPRVCSFIGRIVSSSSFAVMSVNTIRIKTHNCAVSLTSVDSSIGILRIVGSRLREKERNIRFSMAANAILRRNKTSIVDNLCADYTLILNKADQNELITQREYKNLKSINQKDKEGHVVELLDKIMDKGEKTCLAFLNVLQTDEEIQKTYPELNNILKKENCPLPYPVQACSVDNTVKDAGVKCSEPGSRNTAGPSAGGTAQYTMVDDEHFVDKHQIELINRVNCVADILDQLLDEKVITKPIYDEILEIPTNQKKMRKLLRGPLNEAGLRGKEVFYKFLEKEAKYLIEDLKRKK